MKKFLGYCYLYVKIIMADGEVVCSTADFDFSKPLTEEFFENFLNNYFTVYSGLGFNPVSAEYITKEEYDKLDKENNSIGTYSVSWDHDKTYVNGEEI